MLVRRDGSVVDGEHWAKVSKRGITERKRAKIENPYLNAHLQIKMYLLNVKKILQTV